jgi:hypothetical protein
MGMDDDESTRICRAVWLFFLLFFEEWFCPHGAGELGMGIRRWLHEMMSPLLRIWGDGKSWLGGEKPMTRRKSIVFLLLARGKEKSVEMPLTANLAPLSQNHLQEARIIQTLVA